MEESKRITGDRVIWFMVILLAGFSLLAVYSATGSLAFMKQKGNTEFYLIKHGLIILFGLGLMYAVHLIPYHYFAKASILGMAISIPLLLYTITGDTSINEAKRWIKIPWINLTFQSSDLAKIALLTYLAWVLHKKQEIIKDFKKGFLPALWPAVVVCLLIFPSNFSTAAIIFAVAFVMYLMGRVPLKYLAQLVVAGLLFLSLAVAVGKNFPDVLPRAGVWADRIISFVTGSDKDIEARLEDPEYQQSEKAKIAIASGGLTGKMPGKSIQRNFLPSAYSDFIYAIIIEEYGFMIGGVLLVLIYLILLFRGIHISLTSKTVFGALLAFGITFSIVFQALINMAVAVGIAPVTGQTLPMLSMGGTSIWFTCISLGMLQSIARGKNSTLEIPAEEAEIPDEDLNEPVKAEAAL